MLHECASEAGQHALAIWDHGWLICNTFCHWIKRSKLSLFFTYLALPAALFLPLLLTSHNIKSRNDLLGHSQYILWVKDPSIGFCALSEEKKTKQKNVSSQDFFFLSETLWKFWLFLARKTIDLGKNVLFSACQRKKNKIKLKCLFSFLSGKISSHWRTRRP